VHHRVDIPAGQLQALWISDAVIHSWDLATAIGVDPGLDDQVVELAYGYCASMARGEGPYGGLYVNGWFALPPTQLLGGATVLDRLIHLAGR
jgi:hypothetical protein